MDKVVDAFRTRRDEALASLMAEESTEGRKGKQTAREMEPRSDVWPYFVRFTDDEDGKRKARCKRCDKVLLAMYGTNSLWKHVEKCGGHEAAAVGVEAAGPPQQQPPPQLPFAHASDAAAGAHEQPATPTHLGPADIQIQARLHMPQRNTELGPRAQPMKPAVRVPPAPQRRQKPYRGVRKRYYVKWEAEIRLRRNSPPLLLGSFDTAEEAALAYDQAAYRLHGHAARLNFPDKASLAPIDPAMDAKLQASLADAPVVEAATAAQTNNSFDEGSGSGSDADSFMLSEFPSYYNIDNWNTVAASPSNCSSHEGSVSAWSPSNFSYDGSASASPSNFSYDGSASASPSNFFSHEGSDSMPAVDDWMYKLWHW